MIPAMDPRLATNRRNWNQRVPVHAASNFYDLAGFKAGRISLNEIERREVGPVAGKSLLHLQCHFGMDTMSWSRLGARATGIDFSAAAIELARELSAELALDTRFICSNVYDLPRVLDEQFDIVYTASGVLVWLPDLGAWADVVARFVKPGGTFYLLEGHPLCHIFADDDDLDGSELRVRNPYFPDPAGSFYGGDGYSYAGDETIPSPSYEWRHSMAEIVNAHCWPPDCVWSSCTSSPSATTARCREWRGTMTAGGACGSTTTRFRRCSRCGQPGKGAPGRRPVSGSRRSRWCWRR